MAKALKEVNPDVFIAAVEPSESAVMSGGEPGTHGIFGIGDGFIPAIASDGKGGIHEVIDEVVCIPSADAKDAAQYIEEEYGYCVGISSGAHFLAAKKLQNRFKTVVTVFSDGFSKYASHGLKHCKTGECKHEDIEKNIFELHKTIKANQA